MKWPLPKTHVTIAWAIELRTVDVDDSLHSGLMGKAWHFRDDPPDMSLPGIRFFRTREVARAKLQEITESENDWVREHYKYCRVVKVINTVELA